MNKKEALQKNAVAKLQVAVKQPSDQELAGVEERYKHNVPDPASDKWKVKDKPKTFMKDKPCK